MATENILMPQLGESVTEGTISKWLVSVGDIVNKYDPIAEVMTDKVNAEVPSSFGGTIKELVAEEGQTLEVGELICYIEVEGEAVSGKKKEDSLEDEQQLEEAPKDEEPKVEARNETTINETQKKETAQVKQEKGKTRYSPAVLRLSQEHEIDLEQVDGSGREGRITRKDVMKLIESGTIPRASDKPKEQASLNEERQETAVAAGDIEIPVTGVRKAIADKMVKSKHESAHAWTMIEVDVTNLVQYRNRIKNDFKQKEGYSITFMPFFIKAVVEALKKYPQINSIWAGDKIIQKKDINISIAVATDDALYVPVIKHADEKSIKGIAREVHELAGKVRSGKFTGDDMKDGTFTVNNTGSFGSIQSQPIINAPQAAIVTMEAIVKRPVVMENNMIAVRDMVNVCISLDHRILDGLICGQFLAHIKQSLETISDENTSIY
jgi:2-oxoisovalerate dehydrogenase E2 component (dihydrolipoyl transacylase)